MRITELLTQADTAAAGAANQLARDASLRRGDAHRHLLRAHLGYLIEGHGEDATYHWLAELIERISEGETTVAELADVADFANQVAADTIRARRPSTQGGSVD